MNNKLIIEDKLNLKISLIENKKEVTVAVVHNKTQNYVQKILFS